MPQYTFKNYKEEHEFKMLQEELRTKRLKSLLELLSYISVLYIAIIVVIFLFFRNGSSPLTFFTEGFSYQKRINALNEKVEDLSKELNAVKITTLSANTSKPDMVNILEEKVANLQETIQEDPDKALTSRLLREKQKNLESQMSEIKTSISQLNSKIDTLVVTAIGIPLAGGVISIAFKLYLDFQERKNSK